MASIYPMVSFRELDEDAFETEVDAKVSFL